MLKFLRNKKTAKKVWIGLALIIVPAFVFWGAGSISRDKQRTDVAGRLFGRKVSQMEFKEALDAVRNQAVIRFGENISQVQKYLNLEAQAWVRLMLVHEAKRRGIKAGDREVIETIESYPFFQRNGTFDNRIYAQMLEYAFHTQPRVFEEEVRQDLMIGSLYELVTGGVSVTEQEIRQEYLRANQQLSLYYIAANPTEFSKDIEPGVDDLKGYFRKHALDFKKPLSYELSYIATEDEEKIKQTAHLVNKKKSLEEAAAELGLNVKDTGSFTQTGPIPGIGWSSQIMDLVSLLAPGQVSAPVRLDKYYYIMKLKAKKPPYVPEFETIKTEVKDAYIKDKSTQAAKEKIDDCLEKLQHAYEADPKKVNFERSGEACGLKAGVTSLFKYGSYIDNIGGSDAFFEAAARLGEDEFSPVISLPSGFYIVKVKYRSPLDEEKFAAEKTDFSQKVLQQKKQEHFNSFVEELKKKA